jgi:hypothetical protein
MSRARSGDRVRNRSPGNYLEIHMHRISLMDLAGSFAVARLRPEALWPDWLPRSGFLSVTRTAEELSVIAPAEAVPDSVQAVRGFAGFVVRGPLPFDAVGILAALATPLAEAGIPILAVSSFDTDYLFVPEARLDAAVRALRAAGHAVDGPSSGHSSASSP